MKPISIVSVVLLWSISCLAKECTDEYIDAQMAHFQEQQVTLSSKKGPLSEKWSMAFPIAVFGTLRKDHGAHEKMGAHQENDPEGASQSTTHPPLTYNYHCSRKGFLGHFYAKGLELKPRNNSTTPFEIYFYEPNDWAQAIRVLDPYESFDPNSSENPMSVKPGKYVYLRTLSWIYLFPEGYEDHWTGVDRQIWESERDSKIPTKDWRNYKKIPCWIYLQPAAGVTSKALSMSKSPLIWPGFNR